MLEANKDAIRTVADKFLRRKSFIVLLICFSFIAGIVAHSFFDLKAGFFWPYNLLCATVTAIIIFWRSEKTRLMLFGAFFIMLGFARFDISINGDSLLSKFWEKEIRARGIVIEEAINKIDKQQLVVLPEEINGLAAQKKERILVAANLYPKYQYGDRIQFFCRLQKPKKFDDFNYERYLSIQDIYGLCYYPEIVAVSKNNGSRVLQKIFVFKEFLISKISASLHEPLSSFAAGLAVGARSAMPPELLENFNRTGTAHLVAISGWNITLLGKIFLPVLLILGFWRGRAFYAMAALIFVYAITVGFAPSVMRAAVMGIIALWAHKNSRLNSAGRALLYSAALMFLINPRIIYDAGFWLSVSATFGLTYFAPIAENYLGSVKHKKIRESIGATLSAIIFTLPMSSFIFGRITIWSLAANIFILPFSATAIVLSFLSGLAAIPILNQPALSILFLPTAAVLKFIIIGVDFFARMPFGYFGVKINFLLALALYAGLISFTFYKSKQINDEF